QRYQQRTEADCGRTVRSCLITELEKTPTLITGLGVFCWAINREAARLFAYQSLFPFSWPALCTISSKATLICRYAIGRGSLQNQGRVLSWCVYVHCC